MRHCLFFALIVQILPAMADIQTGNSLTAEADSRIEPVLEKVVAWRRDIHEHPELSNR